MVKATAIRKVVEFDDFNEDNDPYHDFGSFELCNRRFFWKIDLYEEPGVKGNNEEPVVSRVLTIKESGATLLSPHLWRLI